VIDGDTIIMGEIRVRLHGIDAPERDQMCEFKGHESPCGVIAQNVLIGFLLNTDVSCTRRDVDRYGRLVGECFADGFDVSAGMVRAGQAVAYREYSLQYVTAEEEAARHKRGIWGGTFLMPWEWRARSR